MWRCVGVCAAIFALGTAATAADLPRKAVAPEFYDWSGLYIGSHNGAAWGNVDWTFNQPSFTSERISHDGASLIAGGQIGLQRQWGTWLLGVEASFSIIRDLDDTTPSALLADRSRRSEISDLILVTARLGYVSGRSLAYVKGGYANADVEFSTFRTSTGGPPSTFSSHREHGWTVGAGYEFALWHNLSFGVEYNFVRLNIDDRTQSTNPSAANVTVTDADANIHAVMARMNYRFNLFGPVSARY